MNQRPITGKDYRILAVTDPEQNVFVGRLLTVYECSLAEQGAGMWRVSGRVHGLAGNVTLTAALQKNSGNCLCKAYDFPHSRTKACT